MQDVINVRLCVLCAAGARGGEWISDVGGGGGECALLARRQYEIGDARGSHKGRCERRCGGV